MKNKELHAFHRSNHTRIYIYIYSYSSFSIHIESVNRGHIILKTLNENNELKKKKKQIKWFRIFLIDS